MKSFYRDLTEPDGTWAGLYAQVGPEAKPSLRFETSHNRRFKLVREHTTPLLWGKIEAGYYGSDKGNQLSADQKNRILLSHFDTRPIFYSAMRTTCKMDDVNIWGSEVKARLIELGLEDHFDLFDV